MNTALNDGKLYEKIGNRYHPVSSLHAYDGLGEGHWLVSVDSDFMSVRQCVIPDRAGLQAAIHVTHNKLAAIIAKYTEARVDRPLTAKEVKAVQAYREVMGEERSLYFEYPVINSLAEEILTELIDKK